MLLSPFFKSTQSKTFIPVFFKSYRCWCGFLFFFTPQFRCQTERKTLLLKSSVKSIICDHNRAVELGRVLAPGSVTHAPLPLSIPLPPSHSPSCHYAADLMEKMSAPFPPLFFTPDNYLSGNPLKQFAAALFCGLVR